MMFGAIDNLDAELAELSRLHLAYEEAAARYNSAEDEANELSAAVGRFLVSRGWEGKI